MEVSLNETVVRPGTPDELWPVLLDVGAVTGFLGVAEEIREYRPEDPEATDGEGEMGADAESDGCHGYTFRIVGLGGGVYHAAFDEVEEPNRLVYAVWRDDTPDAVMLLTFALRGDGQSTVLTGNVTFDVPIEEIFGLYGSILMPVVEPMAKGYMAHRLRKHLRELAATA